MGSYTMLRSWNFILDSQNTSSRGVSQSSDYLDSSGEDTLGVDELEAGKSAVIEIMWPINDLLMSAGLLKQNILKYLFIW